MDLKCNRLSTPTTQQGMSDDAIHVDAIHRRTDPDRRYAVGFPANRHRSRFFSGRRRMTISREDRVERIEQVAALISDNYRTNSEGMLINANDLARMLVDAALRSQGGQADVRQDGEIAKHVSAYLGFEGIDAEDVAYLRNLIASQAPSEASSGVEELTKQAIVAISGQNWSDTKLTDGEIACIEMAVMFTLRASPPPSASQANEKDK
jgi:hypothetical protein